MAKKNLTGDRALLKLRSPELGKYTGFQLVYKFGDVMVTLADAKKICCHYDIETARQNFPQGWRKQTAAPLSVIVEAYRASVAKGFSYSPGMPIEFIDLFMCDRYMWREYYLRTFAQAIRREARLRVYGGWDTYSAACERTRLAADEINASGETTYSPGPMVILSGYASVHLPQQAQGRAVRDGVPAVMPVVVNVEFDSRVPQEMLDAYDDMIKDAEK